MAVRRAVEEVFAVEGDRETWLQVCEDALEEAGFSDLEVNRRLCRIEGSYRSFTTVGDIVVTLTPEGQYVRITAKATANVDNVFALFSSPGQKILDRFLDEMPE